MSSTAHLLTDDERCQRLAYWSQSWKRSSLFARDFLEAGIRAGLVSTRPDYGEHAGEEVVSLFRNHELEPRSSNDYDVCIHIASLCDAIVTAVRPAQSQPWLVPEPATIGKHTWKPEALLAPSRFALRRVVVADRWDDDRHYQTCRAWNVLGEVCAYGMPMELVVAITGQFRDGKYRSYWTHGIRHPFSKQLRFRRRNFVGEGFKDTWREVWREDDDTFPTTEWLDAMQADGVLQDVCFRVDVEVPKEEIRKRILGLAEKKLDRIMSTQEVPEPSLSVCSFPRPCPFLNPCSRGDAPNGSHGFLRLDRIAGAGPKA